jgi:hypothetical protein
MDGIALKPLTVAFHEYGFVSKLNRENQFGPWFTLSDRERQQLGDPMGPANPQALNRYSYTLNNPVRYTDPSGHDACGTPTPGSSCGKPSGNPGGPPGGGNPPGGGGQSAWERFWNWLTGKTAKPKAGGSSSNQPALPTPGIPPKGRAPEFPGGTLTQDQFLKQTQAYLGSGYREVSPGRYVSADGMRQVRYGSHETGGTRHHAHFEAYDKPYHQGGRVVENTAVEIIP